MFCMFLVSTKIYFIIPRLLQEGYSVNGDKNSLSFSIGNKAIMTRSIDRQNMFYLNVRRIDLNLDRMESIRKCHTCNKGNKIGMESGINIGKKINIRGCAKCNKAMKNRLPTIDMKNHKNFYNNGDELREIADEIKTKDLSKHQKKSNSNEVIKKFNKSIRRSEVVKDLEVNNKKKQKYVAIMDINEAHDSFGHMNEESLRKTCKLANIKLTGKMKDCLGCLESKARAKNVSKLTNVKSTISGERIFIDTSGPYPRSMGGNKYWLKMVDDSSRKNWNYFMKKKSDVTSKVEEFLKTMKSQDVKVKYIRCDNAGEHQSSLRKLCRDKAITLEYTSPNTPQQNGVVERAFATDLRRLHAMFIQSRLNKTATNKL